MDEPAKDWRTVALSYERYIGQVERERNQDRAALDAARATIAEQAAEVNRLRAVVRAARKFVQKVDLEHVVSEHADAVWALRRALDATPTRKDDR